MTTTPPALTRAQLAAWSHVFRIGVITIAPGEFRLANSFYRRRFPLTPEHEARYREWFAREVVRTCVHVPTCVYEIHAR